MAWKKATRQARRYAVLAFMAAATCLAIFLAMRSAGSGSPDLLGMVLHAFEAGFGLEFIGVVWRSGWGGSGGQAELSR